MISNLKSEKENREYLKSIIGVDERNYIDWKNSIGKEIGYRYDWKGECSKGVLKIVKYDTKSRKLYFKGYEKGIGSKDLARCRLGSLLNFISSQFKYEIGDTINHLTIIDRELIDREYICGKKQKLKYYKYHCNKCGNEDWIRETSLKKGGGCNACCPAPRKVVLGINTIWDKAGWMIDLGVSEEDSKTHTPNDAREIYVECPDCKRIKRTTPNNIYNNHSIGCSCGDGVSYPEKLMESILIQLDVKYERQYKPDWSQNRRYDFYLLDTYTIIEIHGVQHYSECRGFTRKTLKEEQENDKLKKELALNNGIKHYIVINCSVSDLQYIKNNILDSELNKLFDLRYNINWVQCEEYALKNKVKEVCDYYKKHPGLFTSDLAKEFGMSRSAISEYLKQGMKLGWCEYNGKEEMKRAGERSGKRVSQFTIEGEFIKTYPSTMEAERQTGINNSYISACCRGKRKKAGGYTWRYLD